MIRSYSELVKMESFLDRYRYLRIGGKPGEATFGFERYLNQQFYTSSEWRDARKSVAIRDNGMDLGVSDHPIMGRIYVHHINPLTSSMITRKDDLLLDPENLISVSLNTHNAIHYGSEKNLQEHYKPRERGDTRLW